jgi:hypothetical protein
LKKIGGIVLQGIKGCWKYINHLIGQGQDKIKKALSDLLKGLFESIKLMFFQLKKVA